MEHFDKFDLYPGLGGGRPQAAASPGPLASLGATYDTQVLTHNHIEKYEIMLLFLFRSLNGHNVKRAPGGSWN